MKKRILSVVLSIVMLIGLLPTTALAMSSHSEHPVCGAAHSIIGDHTGLCEGVEWQPLSSILGEPDSSGRYEGTTIAQAGNYYLDQDIPLYDGLIIAADVSLCLNGHTLTYRGTYEGVTVKDGAVLNICDCSEDESGMINTYEFQANTVAVRYGTVNLYSGTLKSEGSIALRGYVEGGDYTVNQYGGTAWGDGSYDAVSIEGEDGASAVYNLYGGTVKTTSTNAGGAISIVENAELSISGAPEISNASTWEYASDIYTETPIHIAGTLTADAPQYSVSYSQWDDASDGYIYTGIFTDGWPTYMANEDHDDYFVSADPDLAVLKDTETNELMLGEKPPEAKWGTSAENLTGSGTLADAFTASPAYIQLQTDITLNTGITVSSGTVTLDLNGQTITAGTANVTPINVDDTGTLTLIDSTGGGEIIGGADEDSSAVCVGWDNYGGTLNIGNGTSTNTFTLKAGNNKYSYGLSSWGTVVVNQEFSVEAVSEGRAISSSGTFTGNNKHITAKGEIGISKGTATGLNATVTDAYDALVLGSNLTSVTITGGSYTGTRHGLWLYGTPENVVTISGGTFTCESGSYNTAIDVNSSNTYAGILAEGCYYTDGENNTAITDETTLAAATKLVVKSGGSSPAETHSHDMSVACGSNAPVAYTAWDGTGTPTGSVYLTADVDEAITITGTVLLCLNGHSITSSSGAAITVNSGATLYLCDCVGTGTVTSTASGSRGIDNSGTLNVYGGTVSGNTYGIANDYGTLNVYGGTVTGGTGISNYGTLAVSGGTVTGTHTIGGYGIVNYSTFKLSGAPAITGSNNNADVVVDGYQKVITIDGALTYTTPISVEPPSRYNAFTSGWSAKMSDADYNDYFIPASGWCVFVESDGELKPAYTVTYDGNGATSGSVPTDSSSPYSYYSTVTVLGNTGGLAKAGYTFAGWNTKADGTGTDYDADETFTITEHNTLYAKWTPPTYTVAYNANGATSGTVPTDGNSYTSGSTVTALGNTGGLAKTGYAFVGWNTNSSGYGTDYAPNATFEISGNTTLYAQWEEYEIITQPTESTPAVSTNADGDIASYQWYKGTMSDVTDAAEGVSAYTEDELTSSYSDGWWTCHGTDETTPGYFTIELNAGDSILAQTSAAISEGQLGIWAAYEKQDWDWTTPDDHFLVTAPADGNYDLHVSDVTYSGGTQPTVKAQVFHIGSTPADGATSKTLVAAEDGWYACKITYNDGTVLYSGPVEYEAPTTPISGTVSISGSAKYSETLTASYTSDETISYQWYRGETPISGATNSTYKLTKDDIGQTIKVIVTGTGDYSGTKEAVLADGVEKADGPAAPAGLAATKPSEHGASDGRITGVDTTMEYSTDGSNWTACAGDEITNLSAGTYYIRVAETATQKASTAAMVTVPDGTITVTWIVDGVTTTEEYEYGATPSFKGSTDKPATAQYSYTFKGWTPEITAVTGDVTYTATYTETVNKYTVTFYDEDGTTVLESTEWEYGQTPVYNNGNNPTKQATAEKTYTFAGWYPAVVPVTENASYKATFTDETNTYTVTWYDEDGTTVLETASWPYGSTPSFTGSTPTKAADAQYTYTFEQWMPVSGVDTDGKITGTASYKAVYNNTVNTYTVAWKNGDTVLETDVNVPYGTTPSYDGDTPAKAATAQYTYSFKGWDKEIEAVTGDITYTAQFDSTVNRYTVTFDAANGDALTSVEVNYGDKVAAPADPTKEGYIFAGWYTAPDGGDQYDFNSAVDGNITLYARWSSEPVYDITGKVEQAQQSGEPIPAEGVTVTLRQGNTVLFTKITDANGEYDFHAPAGSYNIVAETEDGKTMTQLVTVTDHNERVGKIILPYQNVSSELTIPIGTPDIVVGGLDKEVVESNPNATSNETHITLSMTVEQKEDVTSSETPEDAELKAEQEEIKTEAGSQKNNLTFLKIDLTKVITGDGAGRETVTTTTNLLKIIIPFETSGRQAFKVYRYHGSDVDVLTTTANADGEYIEVSTGSIIIHAKKFSTYAIGYTVPASSGGYTPTYAITVEKSENGEVKANRSYASNGTTVTITVTPEDGYVLKELSVADSQGNKIEVTDKGNGTYTFKMPRRKVTVEASFVAAGSFSVCLKDDTCPIWPFTDAETTAWYHDGVHCCIENGLMAGYGDGIFKPNADTTRAMITVMLWRLNGSPVVDYLLDFEDVEEGKWYTEAIRWAKSEGIAAGYGNGYFGTNDAVTREQMVTILWRYAQYKGIDVSVGEDTNILSYNDAFNVAEYAIPAMQWACGSGMVQGMNDPNGEGMILAPESKGTRAQIATMMMRFCTEIVQK